MTSEWKSTINSAYTNPGRLPPLLEQTIPALIKDEVQRLANLILFQDNVQSRTISSQVPVDMKFTGNSLDIRISKKAPWISLLPSTNKLTMSPEEIAVDAVRRDVMEKIALLWGGISSDSSSESDSSHNNSNGSGFSTKSMKTKGRVRSKRSRRNERNKRSGNAHTSSTKISRNKLDCSTHTINHYYCCVESHNGLSSNIREQTPQSPQSDRADATTQTNPMFDPVFRHQNIPENHRVLDSSEDSSSDEAEDGSTHSFSSRRQMKNKYSNTSGLDDSSSDESEDESTSSFSSKGQTKNKYSDTSELRDSSSDESADNSIGPFLKKCSLKKPFSLDLDIKGLKDFSHVSSKDNVNGITPMGEADAMTFSGSNVNESNTENPILVFPKEHIPRSHNELHSLENEDLITFSDSDYESKNGSTSYLNATSEIFRDSDIIDTKSKLSTAINIESELVNSSYPSKLRGIFGAINNTEPMAILHPIPSKATDPFIEIKKFIKTYDTDSKPLSHRKALIELQAELSQEKPNRAKINNLLSILEADSLEVTREVPRHKIAKDLNSTSTATHQNSTISKATQMTPVNPLIIDKYIQTESQIVSTKDKYTSTKQPAQKDNYSNTTFQNVKTNSIETEHNSLEVINNLEELVSIEDITILSNFVNDSIEQTDIFKDIVNTHRIVNGKKIEVELDLKTMSFLLQNRDILIDLQNLLDSDPQLVTNNNRVNSLLDQLDLDTLRLIYDNPELEIPFIGEDFDDASTLVGSIVNRFSPQQVNPSIEENIHQTNEERELLEKLQELLAKVERLDGSISLPIQKNPTAHATTQGDDYRTDKEIKLRKKVQILSKNYENLAGLILKQATTEKKQQADISELHFQLELTKNELVNALQRLDESTEKKFKVVEDQSEYIRNLERELEQLQEILISIPIVKNPEKEISVQTEEQNDDPIEGIEETESSLSFNVAQETDDIEDLAPPIQSPVRRPSAVQSDNEEEQINELLDQYQELTKDLQEVKKKDDPSKLEKFYKKYANSGIHIQLYVLAEHLRLNQDPLSPSRDVVLKRRQDTLDMLHLFDKTLSEEVWSDDSGNESDESAVLSELPLFKANDPIIEDNKQPKDIPSSNSTVVANASTQSEKPILTDAFTQEEKLEMMNVSTQVEQPFLASTSTQATQLTTEASTQVDNKSDREVELENQLDDTSTRFEKLAAFVETEFKSTEDQFESIRNLETQVQVLEKANQNLVAMINELKKRKILPTPVQEDIGESQFTEGKETTDVIHNREIEIDSSLQTETSDYRFDDLPPNLKRLFHLYQTVTHDLNDLKYSSTTKKFYEKYKESNVIADLTTFAKRLDQIDPIMDITQPTQKEIDNVITQVRQVLLEEKELEEVELAEFEEDFDQRLKKYNELTSDLQKFQNGQLTLAELYNKYAGVNTISELEVFARQERDRPPSRASVEKKIKNLKGLLITFENDLDIRDF